MFADAHVAPSLFAGLSEVDELKLALGCSFALDTDLHLIPSLFQMIWALRSGSDLRP